MKGILNVYKEKDWTSFDVVAYLRKVLGVKKIGHLGTLDPLATGVLPITIGSATKLFDMFLKKEKTYIAEFEFGYETDTLDVTGKKTKENEKPITLEEIKAVIPQFLGEISQMPPQYSAKKLNGQKACDVARRGGELNLLPNKIFIKNIEFLAFDGKILKLLIECGAGTYIRALGRDIANALNTFASMVSLERIKVGVFNKENSISIKDKTKEEIISKIIPIDSVFNYAKIRDDELTKRLIDGQKISDLNYLKKHIDSLTEGEFFCIYYNDEFVGLAQYLNKTLKLFKYFS